MLIRQSFCGPGRGMVRLFLVAGDRHSILEQGPSEPVTMCVSLVSQYHLTSVLRGMFLAYVRHASIGCVRFLVFDDPLTLSPQRHLYMLSLRLMLTIVTPCWLGCLDLIPTSFMLNAAARVITGTRKFDRGLSDLLHSELHWLDIYQRVQYKLGVTIYRCLQNRAPHYLVDCCVCVSDVSSRQCLGSANRRQRVVPRHRHSKFGRRSFSIAAPLVWNSFPDCLRDPMLSIDNFRSALKTQLFAAQRDT